jgi:hypothetical protein
LLQVFQITGGFVENRFPVLPAREFYIHLKCSNDLALHLHCTLVPDAMWMELSSYTPQAAGAPVPTL